jgi:hypothetical protein
MGARPRLAHPHERARRAARATLTTDAGGRFHEIGVIASLLPSSARLLRPDKGSRAESSAPDTRASAKAGGGLIVVTDVLIAQNGGSLH